jgi:hypothetical protein
LHDINGLFNWIVILIATLLVSHIVLVKKGEMNCPNKYYNKYCSTMALESTQPLIEMSTRNLKKGNLGVMGGRRVGLTTLPPSVSRLCK